MLLKVVALVFLFIIKLHHINCNNCKATLDNFRVIGGAQNDFLLCLKESLLIQLHKPILNKSMYLQLFTE